MRALIRSTTGRPFRRAGLEFPPAGVEIDLDALGDAARAAITGEKSLVITPIDDSLAPDEPPAPDAVNDAAARTKKAKRA